MTESAFDIPYQNARSAREITEKSASSFFLSFRFLTPEKQKALQAVYAFFRIVDDCVDELQSSAEKRCALAYWQEELKKAYRGASRHPVMLELEQVVRYYQIPEEHFLGLISGCEMDIEKTRYTTMDELLDYCYKVASLVGLVCMQIFGHHTETSREAAVHLGLAFQLTNILRDVGEDFARGRIYLPLDVMQFCGYSEEDLARGLENENFFKLMMAVYDKALSYYDSAWTEFAKDQEGKLAATKAMALVYRAILFKIKAKGFPVLKKRVGLNSFEKIKLIFPLLFQKAA